MPASNEHSDTELARDGVGDAAELLSRRYLGNWTVENQLAFDERISKDPEFADAARRVQETWHMVESHAASPELMAMRELAISRVRRANARRWGGTVRGRMPSRRFAAACAGAVAVLGVAFLVSPFGYRAGWYETGLGEQRTVELADHSQIVLDANTRLHVKFSGNARAVELVEGQALFSVAKDPGRPFRVQAGGHGVVAVGTEFIVEYADKATLVAMIEGKTAILSENDASSRVLVAGEEMRISGEGRMVVAKADLDAAMAWRQGKVTFRSEPLKDAIRRMNRYSPVKIEIADSALANLKITGVFRAGGTPEFIDSLQAYFPLTVDYPNANTILLRAK